LLFVCVFVCLSVCLLATLCAKTLEQICMKYSGKDGNGPVNIDYILVAIRITDPGIRILLVTLVTAW